MQKNFGPRFRLLHWCNDQILSDALAQMDLTASQGRIMAYIAHSPEPPCARDIEEHFHLSHPSVSGTLSRMEKKGFLTFLPDENDRRCKRIHILPKGRQCQEWMAQTIQELERKLVADFSEEERAQFSAFLDRAIQNMGVKPCCKPLHKEETDE